MIISDISTCIYLANPKTASMSIRRIYWSILEHHYLNQKQFNRNIRENTNYHHHYNYKDMREFYKQYDIHLDNCFTFTTIRDPWDRMVSCFKYGEYDANIKPFWHRNYDKTTASQCSFEQFLNDFTFMKDSVNSLDRYAFDKHGNQLVTKIYKIEDLKLEELLDDLHHYGGIKSYKILKLLKKIPEINKSSTGEKKYRDYYTEPWMIEKVATLFKKDIDYGSYKF